MSGFDHFRYEWFDPYGPFAPLHHINATRLAFVMDQLPTNQASMDCLDVGCGAGIFTTAFAKKVKTAHVSGIDASEHAIALAKAYAELCRINIHYMQKKAEALSNSQYDFITCLELIEHVDHPQTLVAQLMANLKPNGQIIFSTLNRTWSSFIKNIFLAEDVLGIIPAGTHDFRQFIKPHELASWCHHAGLTLKSMSGIVIDPITYQAQLSQSNFDNYIMAFERLPS